MRLVVVESPNKVKKIQGILGSDYQVAASFGHVADLPPSGDLAVDFTDGKVLPHYQALERSSRAINDLKRLASRANEVLLATDPDREGEAIAWHVMRLLGMDRNFKRVVFHAVTDKAVREAVANARRLDQHLVNAQQARRVLDRVVGWVVSPTLRRGCGDRNARSAGRVQSAALRLVCEREETIRAHASTKYFAIDALIRLKNDIEPPSAQEAVVRLEHWKGEELGRRLNSLELAERTATWCSKQDWAVIKREVKKQQRKPPPPFTTATVQQAASLRLRLNPKQCMQQLQRLFEQGHITYHRTDSTALDPEAIQSARAIISEKFGEEFLPAKLVIHQNKAANTQEAHEAIRPTSARGGPGTVAGDGGKLYALIWHRFIACQMRNGIDEVTSIEVGVANDGWQNKHGEKMPMGIFRAQITKVIEPGWRKLGTDSTNDQDGKKSKSREDDEQATFPANKNIPACEIDCAADPLELRSIERKTKAPPRYTQASLIKRLEKDGIGRPSTYAAIMTTLLDRAYVLEKARKLHATDLGLTITTYLVQRFAGDFIDLNYTARLENDFDAIARGETSWHGVVTQAAFQVRDTARRWPVVRPLAGGPPPPQIEASAAPCPLCDAGMVARNGPYGPFYACSKRECPAIVNPDGSPSHKTQMILDGKLKANGSKPKTSKKGRTKAQTT